MRRGYFSSAVGKLGAVLCTRTARISPPTHSGGLNWTGISDTGASNEKWGGNKKWFSLPERRLLFFGWPSAKLGGGHPTERLGAAKKGQARRMEHVPLWAEVADANKK